ncbi:MAG: glycoside hydrolase family 3 N-terminal domain-containing protein [Ktedonobacteraceae bacterium]
MSISNEHSQKASINNQQPEQAAHSGQDNGPTRPVGQPEPLIPSRPMPAQQYQQARQQSEGQVQHAPVAAQDAPENGRAAAVNGKQIGTGFRDFGQPSAPALLQPRLPRRRGRGKFGIIALLVLSILIIIVVLTGFLGRVTTGANTTGNTGVDPTAPASGSIGPMLGPPLNPTQVNALRHKSVVMTYRQLASLYVNRMTLDEELGQLIMVEYDTTTYSSDLDYMVNNLHAGGVIMYEFQMNSFNQTKHDIAQMQQRAKIPLLISTDEEGGPEVHRLLHIYPPRPGPWDIYQKGSLDYDRQQAHILAHQLLALGINEDLAPDVDVMITPGADTVTRTFGTTPASVIKYGGAYMQTMQSDGLIACIKHYPGLGAAIPDAHKTLPVVNRSRSQIFSTELAPYQAFINSPNPLLRPGMIMSTDVLMPVIDPTYPAELSHTFMTDILRKQLGYDGVVMTDALYMKGISNQWTMPQAAVLALNAGNDMLLGPTGAGQMLAMLNGLKAALQNGTLSKERIDEAASRIIALKMASHLMPAVPPQN